MKFPFVTRRHHDATVKLFVDKFMHQCRRAAALEIERDGLQTQLETAQKNDHRDPVTGKYTKAD